MANNSIKFKTPKNSSFKFNGGQAQFSWNPNFGAKWSGNFAKAQKVIDSESLRYSDPLIPIDKHELRLSGIRDTVLGSGSIRYRVRHAAPQYYNTALSRPYDSRRGGKWFERMKVMYKAIIQRAAQRVAGGG